MEAHAQHPSGSSLGGVAKLFSTSTKNWLEGRMGSQRVSWGAQVMREAYRLEQIPVRLRWVLVSAAMRDWFRVLSSKLRPHLEEQTREVLTTLAAQMFERRYDDLRGKIPALPSRERDPRVVPLLMAGLYHLPLFPKAAWIFEGLGGGPRGLSERGRMLMLTRRLSPTQRWEEVTVHLGEILIVLTEQLPAQLPRARQIVAQICFQMGEWYARHACKLFGLSLDGPGVEHALEILRMAEYIFRVNPQHSTLADPSTNTGSIEGNACPWYTRPGWGPGHCGIFGQFQSGVCSVFGLRYQLTTTIPKHGGHICRVDLKPRPTKA